MSGFYPPSNDTKLPTGAEGRIRQGLSARDVCDLQ